CGDRGIEQTRSVSRVLQRVADQGHPAGDGASHLGQEDCHYCIDCVEERSELRRPTSETTNSLSVSDPVRSISGDFSGGGRRVLETPGFESESQLISHNGMTGSDSQAWVMLRIGREGVQ